MRIDAVWAQIISDLFVNLAAGWFGVVLILTPRGNLPRKVNLFVLTVDVTAGIVSLVLAFWLRNLGGL